MIFDTHLHLIDRRRLRYPWLGSVPALDRDWTYDDYESVARRVGITDVLHMEVDVAADQIGAETGYIAELMRRPGSLIRGAISACRPEASGFAAWLEQLDRDTVKGLRRVLHVMPDPLSQDALFRENIGRLGTAGLVFDLCLTARQLLLGTELVDSATQTTFVLDHCGVPDIAGGAFTGWAASLREVARRPNVNVKLSGITAYTAGDWSVQSLTPWVDHVLECFGTDRVVWGSDSPVCTLQSNLAEWVAASQALLAPLSLSEHAAIMGGNARRLWRV